MTKLRHVLCLLFALTVLTVSAQTAPVQWNLADFTVSPLQYSLVTITKLVPSGLNGSYILANSSRTFQTDSNGVCLVTNMAMGYPYQVKFWDGNVQQVAPTYITNAFPIQLAGTNIVDAQNWLFYYILTQGPVIIGTNFYASNFVSFAQVQAAAFNAQTNAENYAFTNTLAVSNSLFILFPSTNGFVDYTITNGLASQQYVTNAVNVATNTVTTNLTALMALNLSQKLNTNGYFVGTANYSVITNPPAIPSTNGFVNASVTNGLVSSNNMPTTNGLASIAYANTVGLNNTNFTIGASNALQLQISSTTAISTNAWSLNGTTLATPTSTLGTSNKAPVNLVVAGVQTGYFGTNQNVSMAGADVNNGAQNSFAEGYFSSASGQNSAAFNGDTVASGVLSFACNDSAQAQGQDAFACGAATVAGDFSFAAGVNAFATTNSFAWADGTQPVGYNFNRQANTFSIFSQKGVQINATNGYTNTLYVNGTIYATTNIYINGAAVITTASAGVQGVAPGTLITTSTNLGTSVVTINAVNQTNGYTSIVTSNAATFLATNGSALGLSGLPSVVGGTLATVTSNAGAIYTVSANSQTNTIAANSLTGTVTNFINSPSIQVGGNVNFTASTNILRVLGAGAGAVLSGTMNLVSSSLYTNTGTTAYYTNNSPGTWTLYYTNAAQFVSSTGVTNTTLTPVGSGACAVFFGDAFQTDGVLFQGQITSRWQQVFYGSFNSPIGNVFAFPPAIYYKSGAGSLWEKTNSIFDANGWDCVITNRPGT